jgi:hypothetical protein
MNRFCRPGQASPNRFNDQDKARPSTTGTNNLTPRRPSVSRSFVRGAGAPTPARSAQAALQVRPPAF